MKESLLKLVCRDLHSMAKAKLPELQSPMGAAQSSGLEQRLKPTPVRNLSSVWTGYKTEIAAWAISEPTNTGMVVQKNETRRRTESLRRAIREWKRTPGLPKSRETHGNGAPIVVRECERHSQGKGGQVIQNSRNERKAKCLQKPIKLLKSTASEAKKEKA